MTRWRSLIAFIIFGSLGYCLLWYSYAHRLERRVTEQFVALEAFGYSAQAGAIDVSGFPYRLVVSLENAQVRSRSGNLELDVDAIDFISHLWSLNHWVMQAEGLSATATALATLKAPHMTASWRALDGLGHRLVLSTQDQPGIFINDSRRAIALSALGLDIPSDEARTNSPSLFADAAARFGFGLVIADSRWSIEGDWVGPPLSDWTQQDLANWRNAGGIINIKGFKIRDNGGQIAGEGSLTLDEENRPMATFNRSAATNEGPIGQPDIVSELLVSLASEPVDLTSLSFITVQDGSLMINGAYAGDITPLAAPSVTSTDTQKP